MASIRYIVFDVDESIAFYRDLLGFTVDTHPAPGFVALSREDLHLMLNTRGAGGAGKAGGTPQPGGWNRFQVQTTDLDNLAGELRKAGATFRGDIVDGKGGRQFLLEDPSGNLVELFEPAERQ